MKILRILLFVLDMYTTQGDRHVGNLPIFGVRKHPEMYRPSRRCCFHKVNTKCEIPDSLGTYKIKALVKIRKIFDQTILIP